MGKFDLPANLNYIIKKTGFQRVKYIGHSQGATQVFSALAKNHGGVRSLLDNFFALAPVVQLRNADDEAFKKLGADVDDI